jgi:bacteriocin-like protein
MSKKSPKKLRTLTKNDLKQVTGGSPTLPLPPPHTVEKDLGQGGNGGDVGGSL